MTTFYEFINVDTFVKSPENRHCEEWSDEAIFCFQWVATTRLPRFARNDTFYEFVNVKSYFRRKLTEDLDTRGIGQFTTCSKKGSKATV